MRPGTCIVADDRVAMRAGRGRRQPLEVTIESMSHEGRGIARVNGKTVFVFGALDGERVLIRVEKSLRQFDQASVLEILQPSPRRIPPRCPAFNRCGGCSLQHLSNDDQLAHKQQTLLALLAHAEIDIGELLPPLRAEPWRYRKKARLSVKYVDKKGRVLVGFRERNTPFIADLSACDVLIPEVGQRLDEIAAVIGQLEARAQIPQIEVAADDQCVQLVLRHLQPLSPQDRQRLIGFAKRSGYFLQLQPGGSESIHNLYPELQPLQLTPLADGSIKIAFDALDFVQVNSELNQQMVAQALQLMDLRPADEVLDLFCGLGNFSLPLAKGCARVTGIEGDAAMVEKARAAAGANQIRNADFHHSDLTQPDPQAPWMRRRFDQILLDPPRSGAAEMARRLTRFDARRILYVSCQPLVWCAMPRSFARRVIGYRSLESWICSANRAYRGHGRVREQPIDARENVQRGEISSKT